jgi:hypothetical protein
MKECSGRRLRSRDRRRARWPSIAVGIATSARPSRVSQAARPATSRSRRPTMDDERRESGDMARTEGGRRLCSLVGPLLVTRRSTTAGARPQSRSLYPRSARRHIRRGDLKSHSAASFQHARRSAKSSTMGARQHLAKPANLSRHTKTLETQVREGMQTEIFSSCVYTKFLYH